MVFENSSLTQQITLLNSRHFFKKSEEEIDPTRKKSSSPLPPPLIPSTVCHMIGVPMFKVYKKKHALRSFIKEKFADIYVRV
jgi:hypothetical protein